MKKWFNQTCIISW